jgi:hypothetical protein
VWDNTNCQFAVAPSPWSKGNGTSNQTTGNFPTYPSGAFQIVSLKNFASGYGYVYNSGDGYIRFDGDNDTVPFNGVPAAFDDSASFSLEFWFNLSTIPQEVVENVFYVYKDSDQHTYINFTRDDITVYLANILVSETSWNNYSNDYTSDTWGHLLVIYDGNGVTSADKLKIFFNGVQKSLNTSGTIPSTTYNAGMINVTNISAPPNEFKGKIAWLAVYGDSDTSRPATNNALGRDMGLVGTNTVASMALTESSDLSDRPVMSVGNTVYCIDKNVFVNLE